MLALKTDVATSQGMPAATRSWKRRKWIFPGAFGERAQSWQPLDFGLVELVLDLASRTVREYISFVLSY